MRALIQDSLTFSALLAATYAATVLAYFILGYGITWLNDRSRIQKGRRGEKRKAIEIRQSMASILVTCTSVAIGLFAQYQGWTFFSPWSFSWLTAVPLFLLCMVLFDAWFYFPHRLLHTKAFYKYHLPPPPKRRADSLEQRLDRSCGYGVVAGLLCRDHLPRAVPADHSSGT